jgi:hypothetical protein
VYLNYQGKKKFERYQKEKSEAIIRRINNTIAKTKKDKYKILRRKSNMKNCTKTPG